MIKTTESDLREVLAGLFTLAEMFDLQLGDEGAPMRDHYRAVRARLIETNPDYAPVR